MRGEYRWVTRAAVLIGELPPRARRIRELRKTELSKLGTTSACAENTQKTAYDYKDAGNYLRVRGEYMAKALTRDDVVELPPRARRIQGANQWC